MSIKHFPNCENKSNRMFDQGASSFMTLTCQSRVFTLIGILSHCIECHKPRGVTLLIEGTSPARGDIADDKERSQNRICFVFLFKSENPRIYVPTKLSIFGKPRNFMPTNINDFTVIT